MTTLVDRTITRTTTDPASVLDQDTQDRFEVLNRTLLAIAINTGATIAFSYINADERARQRMNPIVRHIKPQNLAQSQKGSWYVGGIDVDEQADDVYKNFSLWRILGAIEIIHADDLTDATLRVLTIAAQLACSVSFNYTTRSGATRQGVSFLAHSIHCSKRDNWTVWGWDASTRRPSRFTIANMTDVVITAVADTSSL